MYVNNNNQVIIDALVDQIKRLKLDILVKNAEIEQLEDKLAEKEAKEAENG
jgi:hypothetical protein